jgi:YHS domain-containing protein
MRLIFYAILGFIIYYLVRGISRDNSSPQRKNPDNRREFDSGKELKKDPVCGTYIPEDTPHRLIHKGHPYFFCSETCMKTFKQRIAQEGKK